MLDTRRKALILCATVTVLGLGLAPASAAESQEPEALRRYVAAQPNYWLKWQAHRQYRALNGEDHEAAHAAIKYFAGRKASAVLLAALPAKSWSYAGTVDLAQSMEPLVEPGDITTTLVALRQLELTDFLPITGGTETKLYWRDYRIALVRLLEKTTGKTLLPPPPYPPPARNVEELSANVDLPSNETIHGIVFQGHGWLAAHSTP